MHIPRWFAFALLSLAVVQGAIAGPLNPPAGPVAAGAGSLGSTSAWANFDY